MRLCGLDWRRLFLVLPVAPNAGYLLLMGDLVRWPQIQRYLFEGSALKETKGKGRVGGGSQGANFFNFDSMID